MRGVILAGGEARRLRPCTLVTNKHLLPIFDRPMIYYSIEALVKAGIDEICIVVGGQFAGSFIQLLGNGEDFGLKRLEYCFQRNPGGIAQALALTEGFADGGNITCILADNCFDFNISAVVKSFTTFYRTHDGAHVFLKEVQDPERFGVPFFCKEGETILGIEEKPQNPRSNYAIVGLYLYDDTVYDRIRKLKPSSRGELEVTDLNNSYIQDGELTHSVLKGFWQDCGIPESLFRANEYWANKTLNPIQ